jgi:hypothetical protein
MERHLQILPPPFDVGAREAPLLFPLARLDLLGFCLLGPHPPHHRRIGALHGDSEAAAAARRTAAGGIVIAAAARGR